MLYEDEHLLAVNKPPGLRTAPRHKYEPDSMVQRVLHYLGQVGTFLFFSLLQQLTAPRGLDQTTLTR